MQKCLSQECLRPGVNPPLDLKCTHCAPIHLNRKQQRVNKQWECSEDVRNHPIPRLPTPLSHRTTHFRIMSARWKGRNPGGKEVGECLQAHLWQFLSIIHFLELHPWEVIQSLLFEISKCTRHEGLLFITTSFTFLNSISSWCFGRISSQSKQILVGLSGNLLWQTEWFNKMDIYEEKPPLLNKSVNQINTTHLKPLQSQYFVTGKRETQVLKVSLGIQIPH